MAFTSGRIRRCALCGSTALTVTRESWDAPEHVIVGEQTCDACDAAYLYMRRPTAAERAQHYTHRQPLPLPTEAV